MKLSTLPALVCASALAAPVARAQWVETRHLQAPDGATSDGYGDAVAVSGGTVVIAAPYDDLGLASQKVHGLAHDPVSGTIFGADPWTDFLVRIDPEKGSSFAIGPIGFDDVQGLAFDPTTNALFAVHEDDLVRIDPGTGAGTLVRQLNAKFSDALTCDPTTGQLYSSAKKQLVTVDKTTAQVTVIGQTGLNWIEALAFDPVTGQIFAADRDTDSLYRVDPATAGSTLIGAFGFQDVQALTYDSGSHTLLGWNSPATPYTAPGLLLHVDVRTGRGQEVRDSSKAFTNFGSLYVYEGAVESRITAPRPGDRLGQSVAIEGDRILAGAGTGDGRTVDSGVAYVYERRAGPGSWSLDAELFAPDGAAGDLFGGFVALEGERAVVGATRASGLAQGSGAAYVFERDRSGAWTAVQKLTASDPGADHAFGTVGLSDDTIVVGARYHTAAGGLWRAGAVYVFERGKDGTWTETSRFSASDPMVNQFFGGSIAIEGDTLLVGASNDQEMGNGAGAAYVFRREADGTWTELQKLTGSGAKSYDGFAHRLSLDGGQAIFAAQGHDAAGSQAGAAYVFVRSLTNPDVWYEEQKLTESNAKKEARFGCAVAIEGDFAVVGAWRADGAVPVSGTAKFFER